MPSAVGAAGEDEADGADGGRNDGEEGEEAAAEAAAAEAVTVTGADVAARSLSAADAAGQMARQGVWKMGSVEGSTGAGTPKLN